MASDYGSDHAREQMTLRVLICGIASVLIAGICGVTASNIVYSMAAADAAIDPPATRVELKGGEPQRFEFTRNGQVVTSIVIRP